MMRKKEKVITMTVTLILVVILICIKVTHFVIIERPLKQCRIVSAYHLTVDTNGAQIDQVIKNRGKDFLCLFADSKKRGDMIK